MTFRETLIAKLGSIPALTTIVGERIYWGALPQVLDLGRDGPALTVTLASYPRGHVLTGSDGTASATVLLTAWGYRQAQCDAIALAIWEAIDGPPANPWGDGSIEIMSISQHDETEIQHQPKAGSDQWVYSITSEYLVRHRTIVPSPAIT